MKKKHKPKFKKVVGGVVLENPPVHAGMQPSTRETDLLTVDGDQGATNPLDDEMPPAPEAA